jgi:thiol-disulfide isomerase/thioredoxin
MTIASVLLALLTATSSPASDSKGPALLDFHAEWCGPCHKMRPAVEQLVRKGYPIKTIDIDHEAQLRQRYHVDSVPTFIVVDGSGREIDRTSGLQSGAELARFYKAAAAKAEPPVNSNAHVGSREDAGAAAADNDDQSDPRTKTDQNNAADRPQEDREDAQTAFANPKPWETVVRIRVLSNRSTGFGSGTVIYSTPDESLILTCAHIFKLEGRKQAEPSQFPRRITVDLFDGNLEGIKPAKVHFLESVAGRAVDYDFIRDVGLIRIKPGRRLPACRVVPAHWQPQPRMQVLTVGCSEGHDATAWHTTITKARIQNFLQGNSAYEAIECDVAPKQGRSGGGLFTDDGYIAGICNFAEPQGNHGLYATPRSIYKLLDRNDLTALYAPVSRGSGTLLADGRPAGQPRRKAPVAVARAQSPDHEDTGRSHARGDSDELIVPHPSRLGIPEPINAQAESSPQAASGSTRRVAWQPRPMPRAEPTDLNLDPSADHDHFGPLPDDPHTPQGASDKADATSRSTPATWPGQVSSSRWRAVKVAPANESTINGGK